MTEFIFFFFIPRINSCGVYSYWKACWNIVRCCQSDKISRNLFCFKTMKNEVISLDKPANVRECEMDWNHRQGHKRDTDMRSQCSNCMTRKNTNTADYTKKYSILLASKKSQYTPVWLVHRFGEGVVFYNDWNQLSVTYSTYNQGEYNIQTQ